MEVKIDNPKNEITLSQLIDTGLDYYLLCKYDSSWFLCYTDSVDFEEDDCIRMYNLRKRNEGNVFNSITNLIKNKSFEKLYAFNTFDELCEFYLKQKS